MIHMIDGLSSLVGKQTKVFLFPELKFVSGKFVKAKMAEEGFVPATNQEVLIFGRDNSKRHPLIAAIGNLPNALCLWEGDGQGLELIETNDEDDWHTGFGFLGIQ
jgi:hypothetical protein